MTSPIPSPAGGVRLETFIPWTLVKRGVHRQIITPLETPQQFLPQARRQRQAAQDSALLRALGLAHYWQSLLDAGPVSCAAGIAHAEGIDVTQVRRVLRLALLAPVVVERLLEAPAAALEPLIRRPWPDNWNEHGRGFWPLA